MHHSLSKSLCWPICVLFATLLSGCDQGGLQRYRVSGEVTIQGEPAPGGSIIFTPDTAKGNSGPQGSANIVDGKYDTASGGIGVVGGPHRVLVIATKAGLTADEAEQAAPLANYQFELDLPQETSLQNVEIPASE
ncbi:hypothetical protein Poly24_03950 [Rosistilla carotiformis]|uniref:Carboxypeptidase regulatory-like domain-containing protein n=1 Tax=Rosistilla carotiformis TaxID=2528017 RepID=A0A518JME7_9BACT|nr:hypothetical protein [Rosistilla carotiformis]QDV66708.1 hypothetical protein Poly24_03950 [Rosistilla carotiformis]